MQNQRQAEKIEGGKCSLEQKHSLSNNTLSTFLTAVPRTTGAGP